ncbi:MAG: radical SAM protein [Candidatus Omnitrophica bacterium]|nr:radical SAM protein [Candidatus Omnitrophota bacterium]
MREQSVVDSNKKEKRKIRKPKFSVIEVIRSCPLQCQMCYNWKAATVQDLITLDDMKRYVSQLAEFVDKPFEINLAGGEPLLRNDIFELIQHIISYDFSVSLTTSGYLLNESMLQRIVHSGLTYMPISLDSLDEDVHDALRGRKGTHKKVTEALSFLLNNRGSLRNLTIQTIIMKPNLRGIIPLIKWAHERNIAVSLMALMRPNGVPIDLQWFQKDAVSFLWPDDWKKAHAVIDEIIALKRSGYRIDNQVQQLYVFKEYYKNPTVFVKNAPCSLGDGIVNVSPEGNIYLCWEKGPLGNIKHDDMYALWYAERTAQIREDIVRCTQNCSEMVNCFFEG